MKRKYILKLACIAAALLLTASVLVATSYAWFTMSTDPVVSGIAVTISGGDTIRFAPDMTVTDEQGNVIHFPGTFSDSLDFSQHKSYDYLKTVGSLSPVSTADGVNWFFPSYHTDSTDLTVSGGLKEIEDFLLDSRLNAANRAEDGTYVYIDFWVMSPSGDFDLRVSTADSGDEGSFVLAMPKIAKKEDGSLYLVQGDAAAAASMRVGFLVNTEQAPEFALNWYKGSYGSDSRITQLKGLYAQKEEYFWSPWNRFTIYEPNGDWHDPNVKSYVRGENGIVTGTYLNGSYVKTNPIAWDAGYISLKDTTEITTVQKTSHWIQTGDQLALDAQFQAYNFANKYQDTPYNEIMRGFSDNYLQGLFDHYVQRGKFFNSSQALSNAAYNGVVPPEILQTLASDGATDDVTITRLEGGTAQRIRMFIWLEGQDVDCVTHQEVWNTIVRLEFAGGDQ